MRFTKRQKKHGLIALLILLAVVGIIYFGGLNKTLNVFIESGGIYGNANEISENSQSVTYQVDYSFTATQDYRSANLCGTPAELTFDLYGELPLRSTSLDELNAQFKNAQVNTFFPASSSELSNILAVYSVHSSLIKPGFKVSTENTAKCEGVKAYINPSKYSGGAIVWAKIYCKVNVKLNAVDSLGNKLSGDYCYYTPSTMNGKVIVSIPKIGIQCLDDSYCSGGLTCQNSQCVDQQMQVYRLSDNKCNLLQILQSQKTADDYATLSECQSKIISEPSPPEPKGFLGWLQSINQWIIDFFSRILGLSITGEQVVQPNTQHTYLINITSPIPDSDWNDGNISYQFGTYGLIDKNNNILTQGIPERIYGSYQKSVTITTPSNIGEYALVGLITQIDKNWDSNTGNWTASEERIINKEAIDLKTEYNITEPGTPVSLGLSKFIQAVIDFIKNLWNSIFG